MVVLARLIPPSAFGMFAIAVIVQELAVDVPSEGVGQRARAAQGDRPRAPPGRPGAQPGRGRRAARSALVLAAVVVVPDLRRGDGDARRGSTPWFLFGAIVALPIDRAAPPARLPAARASSAVTKAVVRAGSSIILAAGFGIDASALVFGGLAGMAAMLPARALLRAAYRFPRWRPAAIRDLLPYGGPAWLACFCWAGFRNGDYAIVGARLGAGAGRLSTGAASSSRSSTSARSAR